MYYNNLEYEGELLDPVQEEDDTRNDGKDQFPRDHGCTTLL
jgi:hypothetical protein